MPFQYSYLPVEAYRSPYAQAIAGAMGGADRARALAAEQSGQIAANAADNIGHIASGTLHDLLTYKLDQPKRDLIAAQAGTAQLELKQHKDAEADDTAMKQALQASGGDHEAALAALDARGAIGPATKLRTALTAERTRLIDEQSKVMDLSKKRLGMASQMLQGIPEADDPWTSYAEVLPKVRAVVGPELGKALPDEYDADRVGQAITWGQTAQELLERRRAALDTAREGVAAAKDKRDADVHFTKSLAQWLPTVSNQDEWTQALTSAKALGAPPETLAKFGDQYTPEAAKRAESFGLTPEERAKATQPAKLGTIEDYMATYARDVAKKPIEALSVKDKDTVLHRFAMDHKVDSDGQLTGDKRASLVATILQYPSVYHDLTDTTKSAIAGDLAAQGFTQFERTASPATIASAEKWRSEELEKLDTLYAKRKPANEKKPAPDDMTAADFKAAKDRIEASYLAQTGRGAPAAAKPVPSNVAVTLKGQKPGKYTLSDGSKWIVGKDGSVSGGQ